MATNIATTSQSATGLASIAGVASGLNFNNIVSQLMAVEQNKVTLLQQQQAGITAQQQAMTTLQGYLTTLQNQAASLANGFNFLSYTGTLTSNSSTAASSLVSVQASSSATPGTHTIQVTQLAQAEKDGSSVAVTNSTGAAVTNSTAALGMSGSFTVDGQTVNVSATDSLQNIAGTINALDTGSNPTGVTASVMQVGTNDFRLVLTNDATGATAITLSGVGSTSAFAGLQLSTPQVLQTGQGSISTIDGYQVTSSSNTISSAISGVTLNLLGVSSGTTVTLNVGVDTQAVTQNIQSFVTDYNKVMDYINQQKQYNSTTKTSGPLAADPLVSSIQSQLSSMVLQSIPGLSTTANSMVLIGVTPDQNGDLSIDSTTLNNLLSTNPNAVKDVFSATGSSTNSALSFVDYGSNTVSGNYAVNITQAAKQASITGTKTVGTTSGLSGSETITVKEGSQQATVSLTTGESLTSIVAALNAALDTNSAQQESVGGLPAGTTSATTMSSLGFSAGDTIAIAGTTDGGSSVNSTYTVASGDTVASLLSAIQYAYGQSATATIDSSGNIVLTDNQTGQNSLSFGLTYTAAGGGSFTTFNTPTLTLGRSSMGIGASASGNNLQLTSSAYGSASSFTVTESGGLLGIAGSATGQDVAGTIGGYTATGSGRMLTGTSGDVNGLSLMYTGTATGSVGSMNTSIGVAALFDNALNTLAMPGVGLVANDISQMGTNYDYLSQQIANLQAQMNQEQTTLLQGFQAMESSIASLNSSSQYLTQLSQLSSSSSGSSSFK